jgi:hypothetical protein
MAYTKRDIDEMVGKKRILISEPVWNYRPETNVYPTPPDFVSYSSNPDDAFPLTVFSGAVINGRDVVREHPVASVGDAFKAISQRYKSLKKFRDLTATIEENELELRTRLTNAAECKHFLRTDECNSCSGSAEVKKLLKELRKRLQGTTQHLVKSMGALFSFAEAGRPEWCSEKLWLGDDKRKGLGDTAGMCGGSIYKALKPVFDAWEAARFARTVHFTKSGNPFCLLKPTAIDVVESRPLRRVKYNSKVEQLVYEGVWRIERPPLEVVSEELIGHADDGTEIWAELYDVKREYREEWEELVMMPNGRYERTIRPAGFYPVEPIEYKVSPDDEHFLEKIAKPRYRLNDRQYAQWVEQRTGSTRGSFHATGMTLEKPTVQHVKPVEVRRPKLRFGTAK